jgi:hypothetical protein
MKQIEFFDPKLANEFGKDYTKVLLALLKNKWVYASGALMNSINYKLRKTADAIIVELQANDYLTYVDRGVSGTQKKYDTPFSYKKKYPPIRAIRDWVNIKGLPKGSEWAIQKKIFRFGIKPTNVVSRTIKEFETSPTFIKKYEEAMLNNIVKTLTDNFKAGADYINL